MAGATSAERRAGQDVYSPDFGIDVGTWMRSSRAGNIARAPGVRGGFETTTWRVLALVLLLGIGATRPAQAQAVESELYRLEEAIAPASRDAGRGGQPLRSWRVRALSPDPDPQTLRVTLPDGRRLRVRRRTTRALDDDGRYWAGDASDATGARVRLVSRRGVLVGSIDIDGRTFVLGLDARQQPVLEELTPGQACPGGRLPAAYPGFAVQPGQVAGAVAAAAGEPIVDLLVAYTTAARITAGGTTAIRSTIDLSVAITNEALANSQVQALVRLVDAREVGYVESLSLATDLDRVTAQVDGILDEVHAWRDASGADLVSLMVERSTDGLEGLAWLMDQASTSFAPFAFSVVVRRTAASLTLAHEIGHNLGLQHDRPHAIGGALYPYAFGYQDPPYFRDVMSYPCSGAPCPAVPYFSNPFVLYNGRPMGRVDSEDGARALRQTMPIAAGFRNASGPVITSVWPSAVSTLGGGRVTLQGARMAAVTRVEIGGMLATSPILTAPDTLSVVAPRHPQGPVDITVEDDAGQRVTLPGALSYVGSAFDVDGDALDDDWERAMGLNPALASGADGPDGDPDGDGLSNLRERVEHGHPRGQHRRYFGEGAAGAFFSTRLALLNPGVTPAGAVVRYLGSDGVVRSSWLDVPPLTRRTTTADPGVSGAEFGVVIESDEPLVVDRMMTWGTPSYGAHAETARLSPASTWFLAEGATTGGFNLFYLLQNPAGQPSQVRVRYLRSSGAPLEKTYQLPASSRTTIWVNQEEFAGLGRALAAAEVSAQIDVVSGPSIIVERSMYLNLPGQTFGAGHESAGVTAPALNWFLAEGATGDFFDLFVLVANPATTPAAVEVTYLLPDGSTLVHPHTVPAASRYTIWVDHEDPRLADTAVATSIRSTNGVPVVVERAMWWPGSSATWHEAHGAAGSVVTASRWALAEGEVGGIRGVDTYVLIANTSDAAGTVNVTLVFEDGARATRAFDILARSRFNVDARAMFPEAADRRFGVIVESAGPVPLALVVERAQYWDALGQRWTAGTNALGAPLP